MSKQKGQFVPTVGNMLHAAKDGHLTLDNNNVKQFTVKHSSYRNATNGYLII